MPELIEHERHSKKIYGNPFTKLHEWMDIGIGKKHMECRHDLHKTPKEAKKIFGKNADSACLDHIVLDINEITKPKPKSEISDMLNVRLSKKLNQRLEELAIFLGKTKSDIVREMIESEMIELIDESIYKEFKERMIEDSRKFFYDKTDDKMALVRERDKNCCKKCGAKNDVVIFYIDGNISNTNIINMILLCSICLKQYQRYMLRYTNNKRFAAWFTLKES